MWFYLFTYQTYLYLSDVLQLIHEFLLSPTQYFWIRNAHGDGSPCKWKHSAGLWSSGNSNSNNPVVKRRRSNQQHRTQKSLVLKCIPFMPLNSLSSMSPALEDASKSFLYIVVYFDLFTELPGTTHGLCIKLWAVILRSFGMKPPPRNVS